MKSAGTFSSFLNKTLEVRPKRSSHLTIFEMFVVLPSVTSTSHFPLPAWFHPSAARCFDQSLRPILSCGMCCINQSLAVSSPTDQTHPPPTARLLNAPATFLGDVSCIEFFFFSSLICMHVYLYELIKVFGLISFHMSVFMF